ncbi:MAG: hypothetical protein ACLT33_06895 [Lachnospira pectinoschiza]
MDEGANVTVVSDGEQAVRNLQGAPHTYDVILMDIILKLDGIAKQKL